MKLTDEQVAGLLVTALQVAREKLDPEMPVNQLLTLLIAARTPGITMKDAMAEMGISSATISRNVSALAQINRHHVPGFGLLVAREDPAERRRKIIELSPAGRQFMRGLTDAMSKRITRLEGAR